MGETGLVARGLAGVRVGPVDFAVERGGCLAVTGPSGAGKSLLLRMLADLVPHVGTVLLDGVAQQDVPAPLWRRRVTYVAAEPAWWAATVSAHFSADPVALMADLGLAPDLLDAAPERLSTGERQRFGLIRALLGGPEVLLLDEPTSALDPEAVSAVERQLGAWRAAGGILVIASHDAAQVRRLADGVLPLAGRAA